MKFQAFLKECRDKEVFKKISIYAVFSWLLIQVVAVLWEPLGLPTKTVTFLLILLLIGFPIYIYYIWKVQILPKHQAEFKKAIPKDPSLNPKTYPKKTPFRRFYYTSLLVISTIICFIVFLVIRNNFSFATDEASVENLALNSSDKIGILKFSNNTGNTNYDIVGKMASDWIIHGITQKHLAQVVSPEVVNEYRTILKSNLASTGENNILREYFKPSKIIQGSYYLHNGQLIIQASLTDGKFDKTLIALDPVNCSPDAPLECIEALKQRILGYLITRDKDALNLQENPPKFEAYQYVLNAKNGKNANEQYLNLIERAIAVDPEYFEPKLLRISHYYNKGDFIKADSLLNQIATINLSTRQLNLINMYKALLSGDNGKVFTYLKNEFNRAPFDLNTNSSMMIIALQYVYKPQSIDSIYSILPEAALDLDKCFSCLDRVYINALADLELKNYEKVISTLKPLINSDNQNYLLYPLTMAYIKSGKDEEVMQFISKIDILENRTTYNNLTLNVAKTYLLNDQEALAKTYLDKIDTDQVTKDNIPVIAETLFLKGSYEQALNLFKDLSKGNSTNYSYLTYLAIIYHKIGDKSQEEEALHRLNQLRSTYQFGAVDYHLAQYYAATGDPENMYRALLKAVSSGYTYDPFTYIYDPFFKTYSSTPKFEKIMTYWH